MIFKAFLKNQNLFLYESIYEYPLKKKGKPKNETGFVELGASLTCIACSDDL